MTKNREERRAIDLVLDREVAIREDLGQYTADRAWARRWRRPIGSPPWLFERMGMDDPFAPPAPKGREHQPVYVSGRFVRIDQAKEAKEKANDPLAAFRAFADKQNAPARPAAKQVHTPDAGRSAPNPLKRPVAKAAKAAAKDAPPGKPKPPKPATRATKSGRFRARPIRRRPPTGPTDAPAEGTPVPAGPPGGRPSEALQAAKKAPARTKGGKKRQFVYGGAPPGGVIPRVEHQTETFEQRRRRALGDVNPTSGPVSSAPPRPTKAPPPEVEILPPPEPAPAEPVAQATPAEPAPPAPEPPPPAEAPEPPAAKPATKAPVQRQMPKPGGMGLDDLFGSFGPDEGRVRIGARTRTKKKKKEPLDDG